MGHSLTFYLRLEVSQGYSELFDLHGEKAWELDQNSLITFFRQHDQTSALTGKRQAVTFEALLSLCGHKDMPEVKSKANSKAKPKAATAKAAAPKAAAKKTPAKSSVSVGGGGSEKSSGDHNVGLTVRIEVNLPADGEQETYDRIFKSIKENLLNG